MSINTSTKKNKKPTNIKTTHPHPSQPLTTKRTKLTPKLSKKYPKTQD